LLVALQSVDEACELVLRSKLREPSFDGKPVYVNNNLTKAEARAAYEERCRRRQKDSRSTLRHQPDKEQAETRPRSSRLETTRNNTSSHNGCNPILPSAPADDQQLGSSQSMSVTADVHASADSRQNSQPTSHSSRQQTLPRSTAVTTVSVSSLLSQSAVSVPSRLYWVTPTSASCPTSLSSLQRRSTDATAIQTACSSAVNMSACQPQSTLLHMPFQTAFNVPVQQPAPSPSYQMFGPPPGMLYQASHMQQPVPLPTQTDQQPIPSCQLDVPPPQPMYQMTNPLPSFQSQLFQPSFGVNAQTAGGSH